MSFKVSRIWDQCFLCVMIIWQKASEEKRKKEERKEWARIMGEEDLSQYKGVQRLWKEIVSSFKILYHIVFLRGE